MADNGELHDTTTKQTDVEGNLEAIQAQSKSGWLQKRTKISRKWKTKYFSLEESCILYGKSAEEMSKSILLDKCEVTSCENSDKPYTFCLKPQDTQRKHFLSAETETDFHEWMQAICLAKAARQQNADGTQACVIQ